MDRKKAFCLALLLTLSAACGPRQKPIVVGSKNFTEQVILGEIIAQHLQHRLDRPVVRRLTLEERSSLIRRCSTERFRSIPNTPELSKPRSSRKRLLAMPPRFSSVRVRSLRFAPRSICSIL